VNLAIIQARLGSSRFPRKVLASIGSKTILEYVFERVRRSQSVTNMVVAIPDSSKDDELYEFCIQHEMNVMRGSEHDVLSRYVDVVAKVKPTNILRITSDCPLVDPNLIDEAYRLYESKDLEYVAIATGAGAARRLENRFPDGLDAEWIAVPALLQANQLAISTSDREHVTPFIWRNPSLFCLDNLFPEENFGHLRFTLDLPEDLAAFQNLQLKIGNKFSLLGYREIVRIIESDPQFQQAFGSVHSYDEFYV
jgi:spore coat polysaccharide biosynthesis protein SpsF